MEEMSKNFLTLIHNKYAVEDELEKSKNDIEQLEIVDRNESTKIYEIFYYIGYHRYF